MNAVPFQIIAAIMPIASILLEVTFAHAKLVLVEMVILARPVRLFLCLY